MGQVRILTDVAEIALTVIFWLGLMFPVAVGTFWKWWKTDFGNSYVLKTIALAVVSSGVAIHEMFGISLTELWFRWFITIALSAIPVMIVWRGWVLWKGQRAGRSLSLVTAVRDWWLARQPVSSREEPECRCDSSPGP